MKKVILFLALVLPMALSSMSVTAQNYFVYDGDEFSVMLTSNQSNTTITSVQFSYGGEWVHFNIYEVVSTEDLKEGGFTYFVSDDVGNAYSVDYWRNEDGIVVTELESNGQWQLWRR